jgi:hypothetical protein
MEKLINYIIKHTDTMNIDSVYYDDFMEANPVVPLSFEDIMNKVSLNEFYESCNESNQINKNIITIIDNYKLPFNIAVTLMYYRDCLLTSWFTIHVNLNNNMFDRNKYEKVAKILSDKFADVIKFYYDEYTSYINSLNKWSDISL